MFIYLPRAKMWVNLSMVICVRQSPLELEHLILEFSDGGVRVNVKDKNDQEIVINSMKTLSKMCKPEPLTKGVGENWPDSDSHI